MVMSFSAEIVMNPPSGATTSAANPPKTLAQDALEANKKLQQILSQRAEKLEAEIKEIDQLLGAATVEESRDEPESEVTIPGAKKAAGLFPSSEFLNSVSPFYDEAEKRWNYMANTSPHPLKAKDLEVLADAVRQENERLQAYNRSRPESSISVRNSPDDLTNNVEGLDWTRIAEKVSDASSVKRTATECRISWIADKHPSMNHSEWSADELEKLDLLVSEYLRDKTPVNWVKIADKLGTHRMPIDCMRHGIPRHRHSWTPESDEKLIQVVESCGIDNWQLVARMVSEHVSAGQCQNRWQKTLKPALRKGAWTEDEDDRLRKAVVGYGCSWIQVAATIPGRTNDQCRERYTEHVKLSSAKLVWTDEEDKVLLDLVNKLGNQWKAISFKIGNNKTGQNCRMRYDKLKRTEKNAAKLAKIASSSEAGPSTLPAPSMHEFSVHDTAATVAVSLMSQQKAKGKSKGKSNLQQVDNKNESLDGILSADAPSTSTVKKPRKPPAKTTDTAKQTSVITDASVIPPKPRPKPRPKGKGKMSDAPATPTAVHSNGELDAMPTAEANDSVMDVSDSAVRRQSPKPKGKKRKISDEAEQEVNKPTSKKIKTTTATTIRKTRNGTTSDQSTESTSSEPISLAPNGDQLATPTAKEPVISDSIEVQTDPDTTPRASKIGSPSKAATSPTIATRRSERQLRKSMS